MAQGCASGLLDLGLSCVRVGYGKVPFGYAGSSVYEMVWKVIMAAMPADRCQLLVSVLSSRSLFLQSLSFLRGLDTGLGSAFASVASFRYLLSSLRTVCCEPSCRTLRCLLSRRRLAMSPRLPSFYVPSFL